MPSLHDLFNVAKRSPVKATIFETDFNNGMSGWTGLKSGSVTVTTDANMYLWPNLTREEAAFGGKSLKLDCGKGQNVSGSNTAVAVKRIGLNKGKLLFTAHIGLNGIGENWLHYLRWVFDCQDPNWSAGTKRFWFEVRYEHFNQTSVAVQGNWAIDIGSVGAANLTIVGSPYILPFNEWKKVNFHRLEIMIDTNTMKYLGIWVNDKAIADKSDMADRGPAATTSLNPHLFDNGMTCLMLAENRDNSSSAHAWAYLDKPKLELLT
jgi:hypothetical protein